MWYIYSKTYYAIVKGNKQIYIQIVSTLIVHKKVLRKKKQFTKLNVIKIIYIKFLKLKHFNF